MSKRKRRGQAEATAYHKEYVHRPEALARIRDLHLQARYGINRKEYDRLFKQQNGGCAICGDPPQSHMGGEAMFSVDHDHISGRVRGLVCRLCNSALGFARDNPELLERMARYLRVDN